MTSEEFGAREQDSSIELAYGLVPISYDWTVRRLNAVEGRIQALMVFSSGFIVTGPALVAVGEADVSLNSVWFFLALGMAGANLLAGVAIRAWGEIRLLGLNNVQKDWLALTPSEFKQEAVRWAAKHFEDNVRLVNRKGRVAIWMAGAFLLETVCLMAWGLTQVG